MRRAGSGGLRWRRITRIGKHRRAAVRGPRERRLPRTQGTPTCARAFRQARVSSSGTEALEISRLMTSDTKLPHVGMLRSDLATQKRVQSAMLRLVSPTKDGIAADATELLDQFY